MYKALTFDCYGTLVDWRSGLLAATRACPALAGVAWDEAVFLAHRMDEEARLEAGPWRPYREIVALSVQAALARQGLDLPWPEASAVGAGIGAWPPFAETRQALQILGQGRRLAIVSNVDSSDLRRTVDCIGVEFAALVSAEEVGSYKPAPAHFTEVLRRLALAPHEVLHVAQSLYHDVQPVAAQGWATAWINRLDEALPAALSPRFLCADLVALADTLGPGGGPVPGT